MELYREDARASTQWIFACHADEGFFGDESALTDAHNQDLYVHGGLPCDGTGAPGPWCMRCRFGKDEEAYSC